LVVVSIIGILIAILLPALGGARISARIQATRVTMNSVKTGITQYGNERNGALPGVFSQDLLGSAMNDTGFTVAENAIADLAGGLDPDCMTAEQCVSLTIGSQNRIFNISLIGAKSQDNPGFLELPGDILAPSDFNDQAVDGTATGPTPANFPDILDAFGNPIALWFENPAAAQSDAFARVDSSMTSKFYSTANAGYLNASSQSGDSVLFQQASPMIVEESLEGLLGHRAFPVQSGTTTMFSPQRSLGRVVFHSAGPNGVFAENPQNVMSGFIAYRPKGAAPPDPPGSAIEISRIDDIIEGSN
jgi:type II secretory pathway pseudopilin PulG